MARKRVGVDSEGREVVDSTPMELPLGFEYPEPLEVTLQKVMPLLSQKAGEQGFETEEEANDFDIPDDPIDPEAPWEYSIDQEIEFKEKVKKDMERRKKAEEEYRTFEEWRKAQKAPTQHSAPTS